MPGNLGPALIRTKPTRVVAITGMSASAVLGRTQLSCERIGLVRADVVFSMGPSTGLARLTASPGFHALGAVAGGSYLQLEPGLAQLIAFPSPISIRWGMETLASRIATALEL